MLLIKEGALARNYTANNILCIFKLGATTQQPSMPLPYPIIIYRVSIVNIHHTMTSLIVIVDNENSCRFIC